MTLDEAIVHAREVAASLGDCSECAKDHVQLAEWLEELRKLREAERWIPVSERLPDKNGKCLVSLDFGDVSEDSFVDGIFVLYLGNVIAWKPLPEHYESENK